MADGIDQHIMEFEAYKRYKEDTDYLAAWLATNAQKCGYEVLSVTDAEESGNGASSNKDKKEAETRRKRAAVIAPEILRSGSSTLYVRSKDLVGMAKAITTAGDVEVPDFVCDMVKGACKIRAGWGIALHTMNFDDEGELLEVLMELHGPLHDATFHEHDAKSGPVRQEKSPIDPSGIVSGIDGLSLQSANKQSSTVSQRPHVQPVIFDRGDAETETEFVLGMTLFFWEMAARDDVLKNYWMRYPEKYEATIPGLATDLLIGQIRAMERDFEDTMVWPFRCPKAQYPTSTLPPLFCLMFEKEDPENFKMVKDILFNEIMTKPVDYSEGLNAHSSMALLPQYTACQYFRRQNQILQNAQLLDVGITRFERDERYHPDMVSALKLLQSGRCAFAASGSPFGEDELTKAIFEFQSTGHTPIWMLFGLAVQSHALEILRKTGIQRAKVNTPTIMEGLQDTAIRFSKTIAGLEKATRPFPQSEAGKRCYDDLRVLQERLTEWVTDDKVGKWIRGLSQCNCTYIKRVRSQDNWYLKETPIRAAVIQYTATMQLNHIGQRLEEHSRFIFIMAHLYRTCRMKNAAMPTWPDMEFIIHQQGAARLFGGEAPNRLDNSFHKLLQACGYSTMSYDEYQKIRGDADKGNGDAKVRRLENLSPFSKNGFYVLESSTTESPDPLHANLFATLQAPGGPQQLARLALLRPDQITAQTAVWESEWSRDKNKGKVAWIADLVCLDTWLRGDSLNTSFDILALHTVCTQIWTATLETLKSTATYTFPPSLSIETNPLAHQALALDILGAASTGSTPSLDALAAAIESIILEPCTPSKQHCRKVWNGDRGLAGAVFQCAKLGIEYPICSLGHERELVKGFYKGWIKSRLAKGLIPGAVGAWVDGETKDGKGVEGVRRWGSKQVW